MNLAQILQFMRFNRIDSLTIHANGTAHLVGRHGVVTVEREALEKSGTISIPYELFTTFDPSKPN